jgi:glycosyltransferase involved in cell wall biosynthesis
VLPSSSTQWRMVVFKLGVAVCRCRSRHRERSPAASALTLLTGIEIKQRRERLDGSMADIIYMGINHWDTIKQRSQHLAEGLAQTHRVIYVNPAGISRVGKAYRAIGQKPHLVGTGAVEQIDRNLYLYSTPLSWLPFNYYFSFINEFNHHLAGLRLKPVLRELGWQNDLLWAGAPNHVDIIQRVPTRSVCYDCMDLHALFWSDNRRRRELMEKQEARLLTLADSILVSSQSLRDHVVGITGEPSAIHLVHNAAEVEHFTRPVSEQDIPAEVLSIPGILAGYVGTISHWFDMGLVRKLLDSNPDLSVVCIGPAEIDLSPYRHIDRLYFLGRRPYADIPRYLARFAALLIPFQINDLTQAVNPVKVYEYLATGKPVVSTALRELRPMRDLCYVAPDHDAFVAAVETALAEPVDPVRQKALQDARRRCARENTWAKRVAQINEILTPDLSKL